ncbi:MAG: hypothetical protein ABI557_09295, partial [Aureliella sp.]
MHSLIATSIVGATLAASASAQSAATSVALDSATRINAANALVRDGKVAEAIAEYQQVPVTHADREQLTYNLGVAEYRAGNINAAKTHFTEAAASSQPSLAARSRYNLGNCFYSEAVKATEQGNSATEHDNSADTAPLLAERSSGTKSEVAKQNLSTAIDALRQAIGHYRGSLTVEPNNTDARANIELAGQLLRKLQEAQKQDQQQQDQQQQDQQQQDQQQQDQQQ